MSLDEDNSKRMDCLMFRQICIFHILHHFKSLSKCLSEGGEQVPTERYRCLNKASPVALLMCSSSPSPEDESACIPPEVQKS